jgi:hypothetical protein
MLVRQSYRAVPAMLWANKRLRSSLCRIRIAGECNSTYDCLSTIIEIREATVITGQQMAGSTATLLFCSDRWQGFAEASRP